MFIIQIFLKGEAMELIVVIKIAALIALIAFIVLAVFLVISISSFIKLTKNASFSLDVLTKEVSESMIHIRTDINELKNKVVESLSIVDETSKQISNSTQNIEKEANEILNVFEPVKYLINTVHQTVSTPINIASHFFSAASKAFSAFIEKII